MEAHLAQVYLVIYITMLSMPKLYSVEYPKSKIILKIEAGTEMAVQNYIEIAVQNYVDVPVQECVATQIYD
jgi:hypothetical protein